MVEDVPRSLEGALTLIAERAREDSELAGALRTVLTGMLARLPEQAAVAEPTPAPADVAESVMDAPTFEEPEPVAEPEPQYTEWPALEGAEDNLRLKARASRWVARHGYTQERDALDERYALLDEARSAECYLWMLDRNRIDPFQSEMLSELADLFELTACALSFWQDAADTAEERDADLLLAEAQAALRHAAYKAANWRDPDQYAVFKALRLSGQATRTFFPQLSLEYQPKEMTELTARLEMLMQAREDREANEQTVKKFSSKARYLAGLVQRAPSDLAQWRKLDEMRAKLAALGENVTVLLGPLRGLTVPDELPDLTARLAVPEPVPEATALTALDAPSADVTRVRNLLAGREVMIVGGEVRPEAAVQLERAFGCSVRWLDAAPHTSLSVLSPAITGRWPWFCSSSAGRATSTASWCTSARRGACRSCGWPGATTPTGWRTTCSSRRKKV